MRVDSGHCSLVKTTRKGGLGKVKYIEYAAPTSMKDIINGGELIPRIDFSSHLTISGL